MLTLVPALLLREVQGTAKMLPAFAFWSSGMAAELTASASTIFAIQPSDTADLPILKRLIVAKPGRLRVTMADGSTSTLFLTASGLAELRVRRIWATDTSAEGISGLS